MSSQLHHPKPQASPEATRQPLFTSARNYVRCEGHAGIRAASDHHLQDFLRGRGREKVSTLLLALVTSPLDWSDDRHPVLKTSRTASLAACAALAESSRLPLGKHHEGAHAPSWAARLPIHVV